jgi:hypothetical protein
MNGRTVFAAILTTAVVAASALVPAGCSKARGPSDQPAKTPESTSPYPVAPEFAIDPQFDDAGDFSEGIAWVARKEAGTPGPYYTERTLPGYIDKTGAYIVKPKTEVTPAGDFAEGLAVVMIGEKYGYVDKTGSVVIEARFDEASGFSEGLAMVGFKIDIDSVPQSPFEAGMRYGYIDKTGKVVIDAVYYRASDFSEGLACVVFGWTADYHKKWGYINKTGAAIIRPAFEGFGFNFREGVAVVSPGEGGQAWGFIDRTGTLVMGDKYFIEMSDTFSEGLAVICPEVDNLGCKASGYIDKTGERPFTQTFDYAGNFSEGLAGATTGDGYGYIDKSGNFVIPPRFETGSDFREGLAAVKVGDTWAYINKTGKYVFEPQFEDARGFSEGMAAVRFNGKWGYIINPLK